MAMFSFLSFRNWIQFILLKFLSWYDFTTSIFTSNSSSSDSVIPNDIIREILLNLPPQSSLRFLCSSKSWNQLISSPDFVNTQLKLNKGKNSNHRVLFDGLKICSLPPLFSTELPSHLFQLDSPFRNPYFSPSIAGSVNGLICVYNQARETYIWNPTIGKSKELLNVRWGSSFRTIYGFGYDELHDDYKAVFIDYCNDGPDDVYISSNLRTVVNIYSLRSDSWRTVHDELQGIYLASNYGRFVNGKLYWASSTYITNFDVCNIIYFDVADETWGILELPVRGDINSNFKLGVVGSDLALLHTSHVCTKTSDIWIMKNGGVDVSWTKLFTIKYPRHVVLHMWSPLIYTFFIHFCQPNEDEMLLLLKTTIMIYDVSTGRLKRIAHVQRCNAEEIYVESIVNPLTISEQGRRIQESTLETEANVEH